MDFGKPHPLSEYDSVALLWCSFLKCPGTYLGTYLEPCTPESQNLDTRLVEFHIVALPQYSTSSSFWCRFREFPHDSVFIQCHGISKFSVLCLVNPDLTLGPGFVDFIFLHVCASTVNNTLATILQPILAGFAPPMIHIDIPSRPSMARQV
jgi:hypothetical protein